MKKQDWVGWYDSLLCVNIAIIQQANNLGNYPSFKIIQQYNITSGIKFKYSILQLIVHTDYFITSYLIG